jgi:hypothetical protein
MAADRPAPDQLIAVLEAFQNLRKLPGFAAFSFQVTASLTEAYDRAVVETLQARCPHDSTTTDTQTHAGGRHQVTTCKSCQKELRRKDV